jgi:hypothetical protein
MENHLAETLEERNDRWIPPCLRARYALMREEAVLIRRARTLMEESIARARALRATERTAVSLHDKNDKNDKNFTRD